MGISLAALSRRCIFFSQELSDFGPTSVVNYFIIKVLFVKALAPEITFKSSLKPMKLLN